jgi:hypothetical protein
MNSDDMNPDQSIRISTMPTVHPSRLYW